VVRNRRTFLVAFLTACSSSLLTRAAGARDLFLKVSGQNLFMEVLGDAGPTIVFEAGQGNDSRTWAAIAGPIAQFARVVLYDRAGLGKSLPMVDTHSPISAERVAGTLHALLTGARISPPYIVVGHSLGGLYVQMFAKKYPTEVSGVVLLDSSSTDAPSELKTRSLLEPGTAAYLEQEGIAESNRQVVEAGAFPDVPLTVIAATDHGPFFKEWEPTLMQLQERLASLSRQSVFIVAKGSGHDIQVDRPETVIDAVRKMTRSETIQR
jgi:pimeloyl-ACP methyl ester carboxylesterase